MSTKVHVTDGGHAAAKMRGRGRKACVPRAIAIALGLNYRETHTALEAAQQEWATTWRTQNRYYEDRAEWYANRELWYANRKLGWAKRRAEGKTIAQKGVCKPVYSAFLAERGWHYVSLMSVGQQRDRNPRFVDLPTEGTIIAHVSKHLTAVIDGVIHDTHDPTRGGTRTVYGYWTKGGN